MQDLNKVVAVANSILVWDFKIASFLLSETKLIFYYNTNGDIT